jgi:hypothetical protein
VPVSKEVDPRVGRFFNILFRDNSTINSDMPVALACGTHPHLTSLSDTPNLACYLIYRYSLQFRLRDITGSDVTG